ncbi:MAG: SusC/RagA family TonB-linked outer membrane protein [Candidatus Cyclobacteriaceae bacterium M3_2C_046]
MRKLILKFSYLLCFSTALIVSTASRAQEMAYAHPNDGMLAKQDNVQPLKNALQELERKFDIRFSYDSQTIEDLLVGKKLKIGQNIDQTLADLLFPVGMDYKKIENNYYVLIKKDQKLEKIQKKSEAKSLNPGSSHFRRELISLPKFGSEVEFQQHAVSGTVTSTADGEPLPGVNIVERGTTNGTVTDFNGSFNLNISDEDAILIFSFIGYLSREVSVNGRSVVDVSLQEDVHELEEIVVVGYGTQQKKEITSSVTKVNSDKFIKTAVTNSPLQLVQGKVAGLAIARQNGSDPTRGVQIQLRGVSTVSGNREPLIIIDGVPGGNINTVAPEDIESIDVLRDGSAAAIYGTRGTNGVIIITTKKGKGGRTFVEYSTYVSTEVANNIPDVLTGNEWRQLAADFKASGNDEFIRKGNSMVDYGHDTNWFQEVMKDLPLSQNHYLSISGGNDKTNYFASLNYRNMEGIILESYQNYLTGRLNIDHLTLDDRLNLQFNFSNTFRRGRPTNYETFRQAMQRNPTLAVKDEAGKYVEVSGWELYNPVAMIKLNDNDVQNNELLGSFKATLEILDGLKVSGMAAVQRDNELVGRYESRDAFGSVLGGYNGEAFREAQQDLDRTLETTINYKRLINNMHSLDILGGYSYQDFTWEGFNARNRFFLNDDFSYNNIGAGDYLQRGTADMWSRKNSSKLIAFFGRVMYSYDEKYLMTASMRREGSSKFGAENKWGWFPAVTLGWRLSSEPFMDNVTFIDDLKLRFGYGITGNQGIDPYISLERLRLGSRFYYKGQWIQGVEPSSNPNPDLKWERKAETNLGLDLAMLDNRVITSIDVYERNTIDLLYEYAVPVPPNLYDRIFTNVGEMRNRGIEFTLDATPITNANKFSWNFNFNISYNKNKLQSLSSGEYSTKFRDLENIGAPGLNSTPGFRIEEGQPIGNMFGYRFAGFTDEGKWLIYNENGEAVSTNEAKYEDKAIIGNGLPKIWTGFTNNFSYGDFDLTVFFRGTFMYDLLNTQRIFFDNKYMVPVNILHSAISNPLFDDPQYVDYYVEKGDYVKLDNITIGYTFTPKNTTYLRSARFYLSGLNLVTFTGYEGIDPELEILGLTPGMDRRQSYPRTRTFTLGVNLNL